MRAWYTCTGSELLARDPLDVAGRLAGSQASRGFAGSAAQQEAWMPQLKALSSAVQTQGGQDWTIVLEYELLRLEKRIDAVVLTDRVIFCLEFKTNDASPAALAEAEDYALDLRDFHAGSRQHPIVPILVTGKAGDKPSIQSPMNWESVVAPLSCSHAGLGELIGLVQQAAPIPRAPIDAERWIAAPYRPVPNIIEAATMLFARSGVAEIAQARADVTNLTRTTAAITRAIESAQCDQAKSVVFVTGIPGAGKTLCGLNIVFGRAQQDRSAFLSGNTPLVAVLRAALVHDAMKQGSGDKKESERAVKAALQNVHRFLEDGATDPTRPPHEQVIVFDEAQRAWDEAKARQGTQNKASRLTLSEPAHALDIMARRPEWSVIVALIGNGQEINTGEAGLSEWGRAIKADGRWRAIAAPRAWTAIDPAQRLAEGPNEWLAEDADLDLTVPIRSVRETAGAAWVDALLDGRIMEAATIARDAGDSFPYFISRDQNEWRTSIRRMARGQRRAGLLRSSGAKRLRAEGLGVEVQGDDVPDWFLRRWPDIRASNALEVCATEYACQGLELDVVGLAWDGDFLPEGAGWGAREFKGHRWLTVKKEYSFFRNTYRVLLTRARYETVIYVPRGDAQDATRLPATYEALATRLLVAGARSLAAEKEKAPSGEGAAT